MAASDEYQDIEDDRSAQRDRRASGLSGVVLLVALAVLVWLIWTFAQRPASVVEEQTSTTEEIVSVVVPDVVGVEEDVAVRRLQDAGLSVEVRSSDDVAAVPGSVAGQEPAAGASVQPGTTIVVAIVDDSSDSPYAPFEDSDTEADRSESERPSGKPAAVGTVTVPKLVGLSESKAVSRIRGAGLDPKVMKQPIVDSIGRVYQQDPAPGTRVPEGRKVFVLVGSLD